MDIVEQEARKRLTCKQINNLHKILSVKSQSTIYFYFTNHLFSLKLLTLYILHLY